MLHRDIALRGRDSTVAHPKTWKNTIGGSNDYLQKDTGRVSSNHPKLHHPQRPQTRQHHRLPPARPLNQDHRFRLLRANPGEESDEDVQCGLPLVHGPLGIPQDTLQREER